MTDKLVLVADLGRLKAYRLEENPRFSHPRMELLGDWETDVTQHLSQAVTDQFGRFRNELSDGEDHNLDLERRRRAVRSLARQISDLIERERPSECYLAADARIHQPILEKMDQRARATVQRNVLADLSKLRPEEIIDRFYAAASARSPNGG
jgi:hypothetical protein